MLGNGKGVYIGNANHDDELNMMQFWKEIQASSRQFKVQFIIAVNNCILIIAKSG
jgi:hypothetical protein